MRVARSTAGVLDYLGADMARADEGLQSEGLRAALGAAMKGQPAELDRLLARMGAVLTPKPNLRLAAAFGAEVAEMSAAVVPVLRRLAAEDAAPDTDRAFLPIAAAHGWAGRLRAGRDVDEAWATLGALAADERTPVRLGARDALITLAARDGGAEELRARATAWLDDDDRERRFGSAAVVIEVFTERRHLGNIRDHAALRAYLDQVLSDVADAPRSAERSDARRRLLYALPGALAAVVSQPADQLAAQRWFAALCAEAVHPDLRRAFSDTLIHMAGTRSGQSAAVVDELRKSLQGSAKPLRDPTRLRPGTGRGKATRRTR